MVWYFHVFKSFPQFMIHTVTGFSVVNETEVDVFLEFLCFLYDSMDVGNLISAFSKSSLNICKFSVHMLLKPRLKDFKHDLTRMGDECNCPMFNTLFSANLLENWDED